MERKGSGITVGQVSLSLTAWHYYPRDFTILEELWVSNTESCQMKKKVKIIILILRRESGIKTKGFILHLFQF